jgi:hypothetical protein
MTTRFEVHGAFVLEARALFVLSGVITEGMVQTGMRATLEGGEHSFSAKVHGVEFLDRADEDVRAGEPSLTFSYSGPEKLARWQAIDWTGRTLMLGW